MLKPMRVLVVEDEAAILLQLEATIEDEGHDLVGTAMSSRDAIERLATTKPDLVLLDLNLIDGPTGLKVAEKACEDGIGIVFMTANAKQVLEFEEALGVLAKPFSRTAVTATLRFLAECILTPPPVSQQPPEFVMASSLARRMASPGVRC